MKRILAAAACTAFVLAGCGSDDDEVGSTSPPTTEAAAATAVTDAPTTVPATVPVTEAPTTEAPETSAAPTTDATMPELAGTLTIMAPGPFTKVLEQAATAFETMHPGVTIETNLGHVPTLLTQLQEGVIADVLITPDGGTMGKAVEMGLTAADPTKFAKVPMALVVPAGNAAAVSGVDALADEALRVAVCAAELPCGKLADQLATNAGITISADTLETGGSPGIVTKASTGEIDVGLVFATDVGAGGDAVEKVAIPDDVNVASDASAAPLSAADDPEIAAAFIEFLASSAGTDLVVSLGFLAP